MGTLYAPAVVCLCPTGDLILQEIGDTKQDQRANRTYADGRRETDVYQTFLGVFVCGCTSS